MEETDLQLIEQHADSDPTLNKLYQEHLALERELDKINNKRYLSQEEDLKRKDLQKKKLLGRDKIQKLLVKYRSCDKTSS